MPEIPVIIDGEKVNQAIVSAIVASQVGQELDAILREKLGGSAFVKTALQRAVEKLIEQHVEQLLREPEASNKIKAIIAQNLTDDFITQITTKMWDYLRERVNRY